MRENRPYGSEGGEAKAFPTPMCVREDALSVGCESPRCGAIPHEAEGNCVVQRKETVWRATGSEGVARRRTNPIRRDGAASLRLQGEALRDGQAGMAIKAMTMRHNVVGSGMLGRQGG
jgi:hypothetical protein